MLMASIVSVVIIILVSSAYIMNFAKAAISEMSFMFQENDKFQEHDKFNILSHFTIIINRKQGYRSKSPFKKK